MRIVNKTITTAEFEVTKKEMTERGFDKIWDEIREVYTAVEYDMDSVKDSHDGKILTIVLKAKRYIHLIDN